MRKPDKFVRLEDAVKKELKRMKITPRESYNEIIKRIVGEVKEVKNGKKR